MNRDVEPLRRRLLSVVRIANRLRDNTADLHSLGWDPHIGDTEPNHSGGFESRPPRTGDPRAQVVFNQIDAAAEKIEDILLGLERQMNGLFWARSVNPEPSRGSMISRDEHDGLVAKQRGRRNTGQYVPQPLVNQPTHPGRPKR